MSSASAAPPAPTTTDGWTAQRVGGALCLDFANTVPTYLAPAEAFVDHLPDYASLLAWCAQVEVLDRSTIARLRRAAATRTNDAAWAIGDARRLRRAIYDAFWACAHGEVAPDAALATLAHFHAVAARHAQLVHDPERARYAFAHLEPSDALDQMLWPVARSAAELLTSERAARVRVCEAAAAETCTWLFVDESKNHSRRWCSMRDCGNRQKVRRHYARKRAEGAD